MEQNAATVEKAVEILFHLHRSREPVGVTAVGRALGLPKSSAHRLLATLSRRGLVERDEAGRYRPGIALVALGLGALEREAVVEAARPVLEREAEVLGETFFLAAARGGAIRVLDKAEGLGFLRAAPRVGDVVPVQATAVGKLYLAFAPDEVDPEPPTRWTSHTREGRALAEAVAEARRRGFAASRDEWQVGLAAVAAPVRRAGRMVAAVAAAAPSARFPAADLPRVAQLVIAAAALVEARLAGSAS